MNTDTGEIKLREQFTEAELDKMVELTDREAQTLTPMIPQIRTAALPTVQDASVDLKEFIQVHHAEIAEVYSTLVSGAGLYGQAFFGHRAKPAQRRRLRHLWQQANRLVLKHYGKEALENDHEGTSTDSE